MPEEAVVIMTYAIVAAACVLTVGFIHDRTDNWFQDELAPLGVLGGLFWPIGIPAVLIVGFGYGLFSVGAWLPKVWVWLLIKYYRWRHS